MCNAFSCIVKQNGNVLWKFGVDSHTTLLEQYGLKDNEDRPEFMKFARIEITPKNKDYLNPDEWVFKIDETITPTWWNKAYEQFAFDEHKKWLTQLDKILVRKPIVNPFTIVPPKKITKKHLALLKKWDSVGSSVRGSVWGSVGDSVWGSVGSSVWSSVRGSVWSSVRGSVWDSVWSSPWGSVWGYIGGFFNLPRKDWKYTEKIKGKGYPFQSVVDLWDLGLVPSFDGQIWRLHSKNGIVWSGKI